MTRLTWGQHLFYKAPARRQYDRMPLSYNEKIRERGRWRMKKLGSMIVKKEEEKRECKREILSSSLITTSRGAQAREDPIDDGLLRAPPLVHLGLGPPLGGHPIERRVALDAKVGGDSMGGGVK